MIPEVKDVIRIMEEIAPSGLAEEWDNSGLQAGQPEGAVRKIWIALDPGTDVVDAACKNSVDLLITHHPLILKPIQSIDFSSHPGSVINAAAVHKLAVYAAHTSLDSVAGGLNDIFAEKIGLTSLQPLDQTINSEKQHGPGRVGEFEKKVKLAKLAGKIKQALDISNVKMAGDPDLLVKKAAACTGSGSSMMNDFLASGAQAFISGDLKYHDARMAQEAGVGVIDMGHFASEHIIVSALSVRLSEALSRAGFDVKVEACGLETDPFIII